MIADYNLCLGDLIGVIKTFFHQIGITKVGGWVPVETRHHLRLDGVLQTNHGFVGVGEWTEVRGRMQKKGEIRISFVCETHGREREGGRGAN